MIPEGPGLPLAHFGTHSHRGFPDVRTSQTGVTLVVAVRRERVRIELELKMIFNFIFGRHKQTRQSQAGALADLQRRRERHLSATWNWLRRWRSIS